MHPVPTALFWRVLMTFSLARNLCHSIAILVSTTKVAGPRNVRATHCKDADVQQSHDSHDATPYRNPEDRDETLLIRTCPLKLGHRKRYISTQCENQLERLAGTAPRQRESFRNTGGVGELGKSFLASDVTHRILHFPMA